MIEVGTRLPDGGFKVKGDDGKATDVTVDELFAGSRVVLIGVPGAFTSTCHSAHLPQYVANLDELKKRGVDRVAVMAVNDHHVMRSWGESLEALGAIDFLADGNGDYARALGLAVDLTAAGMGTRCKRFSALVEDRVVKTLNFEPGGSGGIHATGAAAMIGQLQAS